MADDGGWQQLPKATFPCCQRCFFFARLSVRRCFDGGQWSVAPHPFLKVWIYILLPSLQQPRKRRERSCKVSDGICKSSKQVALGPLDMGL